MKETHADAGESSGPALLLRLAFVIVVLFTTIGTIETLFIAYDLATHGSLSAQRAPDLSFGIRSWTVHHALRPGYAIRAIHINSFGLRSPEIAVPKPKGTLRVLLLGDSFTFGMRVADNDVFARRLEALLRAQYPMRTVEVVNAGVLSYCPLLEYLQYRDELHVLEPDLVVLNFDMSDVQDHLAYSRDLVSSAEGMPLFVTERSLRNQRPTPWPGLLSLEWVSRRITGIGGRVESTLQGVPFVRDQDRYLWALDGGPDMDREAKAAMQPIAFLATLLDHFHIPLLVATYPQPWQVSADATPLPPIRDQYGIGRHRVHLNDRPFRKLEAFAQDHGLPFVNATGDFRRDSNPATLFLQDDFHFTAQGHDLYAHVLARAINEHAFLTARTGSGATP